MISRRSLRLPITLAIVMIVLLIALIVGWVLLAVFAAMEKGDYEPLYWTLLSVGTTFLILVLGGTVCYLVLSIKTINLNRQQSNFVASVTHELKSPIASLKLYLQTLSRRRVTEQERVEFQQFMLEDVERLDHLISHMLDAAQLDKERIDEDLEDIRLDVLLRDCAQSVCLRYRVPTDLIRLEVEPCTIRAARMDVDMIFRNLIDNAVKYADSRPQVDIRLSYDSHAERAITQIGDNGRGIPAKLRRKIFGRFVRLGNELQRETPGTGLGLYIVRTLVRRLRGQIAVRDTDVGSGTVFEIQLPARPNKITPEDSVEHSSDAAAAQVA